MNQKKEDRYIYVDTETLLTELENEDWRRRRSALKCVCPCKVQRNVPELWDRIMTMYADEHPLVRDQVVHTLCDGSPKELEIQVVGVLESLWNDKEERVRKKVRRALTAYRRTGNWNVL